MANPITRISETIMQARGYGLDATTVKMCESTLRYLFASEEGKDIASKYAPTADALAKAISGMVKKRIRVVLDPECAPDKTCIC